MNPTDPQRQHLRVPYGQLSYTDEGTGHTFVLVHGLPGSARDFRYLAPHLAKSARVLRLELPGFGESTAPSYRSQNPAVRAQYILDFVEGMGLRDVTLVGHSMGGALVCEAAVVAPHLVHSVGLLSSIGPRPHFNVPAFRAFASLCEINILHPILLPLMRWAYVQLGFSKRLTDGDLLRSTLDAPTISFVTHTQNIHTLQKIGIPTMVGWANDDALIGQDIFESLSDIAPDGPRASYNTGGHNIQKTHAGDVAKHLLMLLDQ